MKVNLTIIPECYTDTNLVETITNSFNGFNHQKGCNNVSGIMQSKLSGSFALGIIDKDKNEINYLTQFVQVIQKGDLFLFKHPQKHHYIIQISPAIEKFILKSAEEVKINPAEFGIPDNIELLKKVTKTKTSKTDPILRKLFTELINRNASQIVTLANWISYFKENTYHSNMDEIKKINQNEKTE